MDPQQELFTAIRELLTDLFRDSIYDDCLPPEGTPYPFVYLADNTQKDKETKTVAIGKVTQYVHVWHNDPSQRGTVSKMLLDIKTKIRQLEKTPNFKWILSEIDQRIVPDRSTGNALMHGILMLTYKFS